MLGFKRADFALDPVHRALLMESMHAFEKGYRQLRERSFAQSAGTAEIVNKRFTFQKGNLVLHS